MYKYKIRFEEIEVVAEDSIDAIEKALELLGEECVEKIEKEEVCPECGGTGEVLCDVWDEDSGMYHPTGSQKCTCQLPDDDDDDYGDDDVGDNDLW